MNLIMAKVVSFKTHIPILTESIGPSIERVDPIKVHKADGIYANRKTQRARATDTQASINLI